MAKIKSGIDSKFVRQVAEEEMQKASGRKPSTYTSSSPYPEHTIGQWGGNEWTGYTYGALIVDESKREVRVADTGHYPGSANAARYTERRLKELGLVE